MHFKREHHHTLLRMSNNPEFRSHNIETLSTSSSNSRYSQSIKEENQQIRRVTTTVPRQDDSAASATPSSSEEEKLKEEEDEENDGFKTPTSLDHKILVPSQCPPAPRKTKPSLKRKASCFNHCNCRHPLDLSKDVFELLFPTQHISPLSGSQQSTKKVRRHDHN